MKCKKTVLSLMLAAALAVCLSVSPAFAAAEMVEPMEISDETLLSIAEELQELLKIKANHLDIYSSSPQITDLGKEAEEIFEQTYEQAHILPVDTGSLLDLLMGEQFIQTITREEMLTLLGDHIGNTVINMAASQFGTENIALSSMLMASKSYVADLDTEYVIVLEYTAPFSLVMDVFPSGEHVITAQENVIPAEAALQILELLSDSASSEAVSETASDDTSGADVLIDYGSSELYTREDMDEAIDLIRETFSGWEGCELHAVRYAGDDCCDQETISWMNSLKPGCGYTQCIEFVSDFHSPMEDAGAWEPDMEYTDWQWWLARTDGGSWELLTWGY